MSDLRADTPLQYIRGVGPRRAAQFEALKLCTVGDLLTYFPFRYELESGEVEISELEPDTLATVRGEVRRVRGNWPHFSAQIHDGTGRCTLRWFNQPQGGHGLYPGATVIASGRVELYNDELQLVQPRVTVFAPDAALPERKTGARLLGVYPASQELPSSMIRRVVEAVFAQKRLPVDEFLPEALLAKRELPLREQAVRRAHFPSDEAAAASARRRLAYEELLLMELALALRRRQVVAQPGRKLNVSPEIDARIRRRFPFLLTPGQNSAITEITRDLASGKPMTRLLQGDVGSGKTVVALYAALAAVAAKSQAAIMAPTELLATQHFNNIERYLAGSRVRRALLRGGLSASERRRLLSDIEAGRVDLVVGTQALLEEDVSFRDLAMVVVDEQHKFGVLQRARIRTKGPLPHYLVMTATPIPRTLAMTVFGDLDISIVRGMPPGRGKTITKVVTARQWETVMTYVRTRLEAGEQAYVVCPLIGEDEPEAAAKAPPQRSGKATTAGGKALLSVKEAYRRLTKGPWHGLRVELLHGGMSPDEKARVIGEFRAGRIHAVVATTVVEVGVDVPSATIMVIEHADRFGLSQLHQLRGRVGRGSQDGLCVLIAYESGVRAAGAARDAKKMDLSKAAERLRAMAETNDGFRIAEADLRQRGPGELLGTRQHGLPTLRVASLVDDFELLELARDDAFALIARDPELRQPEHAALRATLLRQFASLLKLIDAA